MRDQIRRVFFSFSSFAVLFVGLFCFTLSGLFGRARVCVCVCVGRLHFTQKSQFIYKLRMLERRGGETNANGKGKQEMNSQEWKKSIYIYMQQHHKSPKKLSKLNCNGKSTTVSQNAWPFLFDAGEPEERNRSGSGCRVSP